MTPLERWEQSLRDVGCVVCRRQGVITPAALHHVAEGSGLRSDWAQVPLCFDHHQGPMGLHTLGTKAWIRRFRPPGDSEYGLLIWAIEDVAKYRGR